MNKPHWQPARRIAPALAVVFVALAGCATFTDAPVRQATQEREDFLLMQEQIRKVSGRMEGAELEAQQLRTDLDNLKAAQQRTTAAAAELPTLRAGLGDLDQRLRALETAREKDKQELVEILSRKMEQIMGGGAGAAPGRKGGSGKKTPGYGGPSARPDNGVGAAAGQTYEAKAGDTLSGIAATHGVKLRALLEANGLTDANRLRAGQKLNLPGP
ncbi:MAG: LysM domain-containing protein [Kiritimatiellaeota bacterium]|nr:LysM domain-containing protein [Kiritimatiellota bacterium]